MVNRKKKKKNKSSPVVPPKKGLLLGKGLGWCKYRRRWDVGMAGMVYSLHGALLCPTVSFKIFVAIKWLGNSELFKCTHIFIR